MVHMSLTTVSEGSDNLINFDTATKSDANVTTTSTSFTDLTDASITITAESGSRLLVSFVCNWQINPGGYIYFDVEVAGTSETGSSGVYEDYNGSANTPRACAFSFLTGALGSSGSKAIKIQWKVGGGTGTVLCNGQIPFYMSVVELKD